jgi:hypothetical protein
MVDKFPVARYRLQCPYCEADGDVSKIAMDSVLKYYCDYCKSTFQPYWDDLAKDWKYLMRPVGCLPQSDAEPPVRQIPPTKMHLSLKASQKYILMRPGL